MDTGSHPAPKRKGRPRGYEPETALLRAMEAFWKSGYGGTSIDDLTAATGMNRPSLYAAFGDKHDIYLQAYQRYRAKGRDEFRPLLQQSGDIRQVLRSILEACANLYLSGPDGPRGCLTVVTAGSEAIAEPDIAALVVEAIAGLDQTFTAVFAKAQGRGELPRSIDPAALGRAATATTHTLAIRARAGYSGEELQRIIEDSINILIGPPNTPSLTGKSK
jgi:TetR/AcrR family transcriptional regulator, copper-responsive repressor